MSCIHEAAPPVRFRAPLAASPNEVRCSWAFHHPASSARGFSQPFDGLLLHSASSSSFIRAPPLGFKVQRAMNGVTCRNRSRCSAKVYPERQSPFGKQKPWTRRDPEAICYGDIDSIATLGFLRQSWPFRRSIDTSLTWPHASMKPGRRAHRQPERPHPTHC
jgi:hypothetical protein